MRKIILISILFFLITHTLFSQQDTLFEKIKSDTVTGNIIEILPLWNILQLNTYKTGAFDIGNNYFFNDGRPVSNTFYIDDIAMPANAYFPKFAIKNYSFKSGYLSPRYDDTYNSLIAITTNANHDSAFCNIGANLGITKSLVNSSEINFDYNLPTKKLFKNWKQAPVLYVAGNVFFAKDAVPSYISTQVMSNETMSYLQENPYNEHLILNSEYLQKNDFSESKLRQNANQDMSNVLAKLIFPISKNIDLTIGNYSMVSKGKKYIWENALYNSPNNPEVFAQNINTYLKLDHKIINKKDFKIKYTVNISYYLYNGKQQDEQHQDHFWDYGYVGKFKTYKAPTVEFTDTIAEHPEGIWVQTGYIDTLVTFTAGNKNPDAATYTTAVYNYADTSASGKSIKRNKSVLQQVGAVLNGNLPPSTYSIWNSFGSHNATFSKDNLQAYRFDINFDITYKKHLLNIGYIFDKSYYRYYRLNARNLWLLANELTNRHLRQMDTDNPIQVGDTLFYNRRYDAEDQTVFDKNLRKFLGLAVDGTDWIDVDNYVPETYKLAFFSPDELLNNGTSLVDYAGYDAFGNEISGDDFMGFFTKKDAENHYYLREIPAYQPYTMNPYFNYHFQHKYFNINAGLAINYFNANQPVLSDPYTLHKIKTAGEVTAFSHPDNIGDDYAVYVDDIQNPTTIMGYRNGDQWYDAKGNEKDGYESLKSLTGLSPYLVDANPTYKNVNTNAFEPYKAQINFLPQIEATVFPVKYIALNGGYTSHTYNPLYLISMYNPSNYLFIDRRQMLMTNPDLIPEKTNRWFAEITHYTRFYDIAFAYSQTYFDNAITTKTYEGAYPYDYTTFVNDVDTTYQLNKINVKLNVYMPNRSISMGTNISFYSKLDTILPFLSSPDFIANSYVTVDFTNIIKSETLHKITKYLTISLTNSIQNGRHYIALDDNDNEMMKKNKYDISYVNLKISKSFFFKQSRMSFYIDIYNLFNAKIVNNVFPETGTPDDDGYLGDPRTQMQINSQVNAESYRYQYALYTNNPYNYGMPRILKLGISYRF